MGNTDDVDEIQEHIFMVTMILTGLVKQKPTYGTGSARKAGDKYEETGKRAGA